MTRLFAALVALAVSAAPAFAGVLRPVEVGRFAWFLDVDSVARDGATVRFRYLMVTPDDFEAGGEAFLGGWSSMTLDCEARIADLTGFQSLRAGGEAGPVSSDDRPGWPIASGSLEAALADAVCEGGRPLARPDAADVAQAVRLGRGWLEEE